MRSFIRPSRPSLRRRLAVAGTLTAGTLLLTACGGDSGSGADRGNGNSSASSQPGGKTAPGAFNDNDVMFVQGMIPHHEQALEMAGLAGERAFDQEIKDLAKQIEAAQDPEIKTMRSWLKAWGKPESPGMDHSGMDHGDMGHGGGGMSGMMSDEDMASLKAAKGTDFDRDFARMMIEHHNGAIEMAKLEQESGRNAEVKKLAAAVIKGQSAEVEQLNKILDRL